MKPIENQRLLDLVRVCRAELFLDHKLITADEYAWLASLPSKETHARLDDYDELRAKLVKAEARVAELERERDEARADTARQRTLLDENKRLKDKARHVRVATLRLAAELEAVTL